MSIALMPPVPAPAPGSGGGPARAARPGTDDAFAATLAAETDRAGRGERKPSRPARDDRDVPSPVRPGPAQNNDGSAPKPGERLGRDAADPADAAALDSAHPSGVLDGTGLASGEVAATGAPATAALMGGAVLAAVVAPVTANPPDAGAATAETVGVTDSAAAPATVSSGATADAEATVVAAPSATAAANATAVGIPAAGVGDATTTTTGGAIVPAADPRATPGTDAPGSEASTDPAAGRTPLAGSQGASSALGTTTATAAAAAATGAAAASALPSTALDPNVTAASPAEGVAPSPAVAAPSPAASTAAPALPVIAQTPAVTAAAPAAPLVSTTPSTPVPLTEQLTGPLARLRTAPAGDHVLTLRVDPEHLGPVRVVAHINGEGVRIELFGGTDASREALRHVMTDLRRDLAATGLNANLQLGQDRGGDALSNQGGGLNSRQAAPDKARTEDARADGPGQAPPSSTTPTVPGRPGGLDLFA
ncbi:flagellar hook-length control protein FliK [Georgenia sp. SYP-B2076]|uniref:flagellar hook-length control protein FliK n=1 Tax=Georgenia sp. SYP-B2076 TaxID=2495881 RepID=UPI000F8D0E1B|nr:flagellar hook-length control protein FliK [Georgenia sp. SYP-B2076]